MPSFKATSKLNSAHADTLVVHCSDHRFQAGLNEFLNKSLDLKSNYDLLAIPGGPQALTLVEYMPKYAWALTKWVRFLIDAHDLNRMVLIAHQDCGWYKQLPFHIFNLDNPRKRQEDDLKSVRATLARDFAHLRVDLFFAGFDNTNQLTVESVLG